MLSRVVGTSLSLMRLHRSGSDRCLPPIVYRNTGMFAGRSYNARHIDYIQSTVFTSQELTHRARLPLSTLYTASYPLRASLPSIPRVLPRRRYCGRLTQLQAKPNSTDANFSRSWKKKKKEKEAVGPWSLLRNQRVFPVRLCAHHSDQSSSLKWLTTSSGGG